MVSQLLNDEDITTPDSALTFSYDDLMDVEFTLVNASVYYRYDDTYGYGPINRGTPSSLRISSNMAAPRVDGETSRRRYRSAGLYYSSSLTKGLIDDAAKRISSSVGSEPVR